MTNEQETTLRSFAEERDSLMEELVVLRSEKEKILKQLSESSDSISKINRSIEFKKGQLSMFEEMEEERSLLISHDLAFKISEKNDLENKLKDLKNEVEQLDLKKKETEISLSNLVPVYERVTWQVNQLTNTVERVVTLTNKNVDEVNIMINSLKKILNK